MRTNTVVGLESGRRFLFVLYTTRRGGIFHSPLTGSNLSLLLPRYRGEEREEGTTHTQSVFPTYMIEP